MILLVIVGIIIGLAGWATHGDLEKSEPELQLSTKKTARSYIANRADLIGVTTFKLLADR